MPRSSSCLRISCSAGTRLGSGSHTTTAASQPVSAKRALMLEFDRAGTIDEGEGVAEEADVGDVDLDAHAVVAGFRGGIADRVLVGDLALARHGAGAGEDGFKKRGLAGEIRPNQCDAAGAAAGWAG